MILVGSLGLVVWLNWRGRSVKRLDLLHAGYTLAKRLPVVMTYVINLGVPPLLFVQVLYGQQIYSSSVLIGALWISVIFLLMLAYWLIYRTIHAMENSKAAWPIAALSLLVVMGIGQIYSMNMTLMLRPEVWKDMYWNSPSGVQGVTGDPSVTPRWLFVMAGGPLVGGLWAALMGQMRYLDDSVREVLRKSGGMSAVIGAALMFGFGYRVLAVQPEHVSTGIAGSPIHNVSLILCALTILAAGAIGGLQCFWKSATVFASTMGVVVAFLAAATSGIVRDGIRDFTLKEKGFDLSHVPIYPNWSVLIVFLLLFVIMLATIYWLLQVMRQATPPKEEIAL